MIRGKDRKMKELLIDLGLSTQDSFFEFYPQVRDRKDVAVLKCKQSGVICLSRCDHIDAAHYEEMHTLSDYWGVTSSKEAINNAYEDTERRTKAFKQNICNQKWLDVGSGQGATISKLEPFSKKMVAVEPQPAARKCLVDAGYEVYPNIDSVVDCDFNVVTLFHVLEHLTDPLATLCAIKDHILPGAQIIIEVPHANDFLISFLNLEEFKEFTFWSEHLILHTRASLEALLLRAGFKNIVIKGIQRYPLANCLYWLSRQKPGGHQCWSVLRSESLDQAYENLLATLDKTDTLIALANS